MISVLQQEHLEEVDSWLQDTEKRVNSLKANTTSIDSMDAQLRELSVRWNGRLSYNGMFGLQRNCFCLETSGRSGETAARHEQIIASSFCWRDSENEGLYRFASFEFIHLETIPLRERNLFCCYL